MTTRKSVRKTRPAAGACDACNVLSIQGIACHETGCPRSHIDPVTGDPYRVACFECGYEFVPDNSSQRVCHGCLEQGPEYDAEDSSD